MTEQELNQRELVVSEARKWIGTPFHYGACKCGVGVACGPFLLAVHQVHLGLGYVESLKSLPKDWHFHTKEEKFLDQVKRFCHQVDKPLLSDLALYRLGAKDRPISHGAIVVNWPVEVIHVHFRSGVQLADTTKDVLLNTSAEVSFWSPW